MIIESLQNPKIKNLLTLQKKASARNAQNLFVVEGQKEFEMLLQSNFTIDSIFYCPSVMGEFQFDNRLKDTKIFRVAPTIFHQLCYRGTSGIIAVVRRGILRLNQIRLKDNPLLIVLEKLEKPGNLGAILRTADAVGVDAVIISDPRIDLYNPNVVRSSLGCIFTVPIVCAPNEEVHDFLSSRQITIATTFLNNIRTRSIYCTDFSNATALVIGNESTGVSDFWINRANCLIKIPMQGKIDSLNVSNATAICLYEIYRQRNIKLPD